MSIVTPYSLIGHFNTSLNKDEKIMLDSFIERYEKKYLIDLFGPTLYATFLADLTTSSPQVPQSTPFTDIFGNFQIVANCGERMNCDGLLDTLKGFIYYHFHSEQWLKKTGAGTVVIDSENSSVRPSSKIGLANYYNDAVQNYSLIQIYIYQNKSAFIPKDTDVYEGVFHEFMPLT